MNKRTHVNSKAWYIVNLLICVRNYQYVSDPNVNSSAHPTACQNFCANRGRYLGLISWSTELSVSPKCVSISPIPTTLDVELRPFSLEFQPYPPPQKMNAFHCIANVYKWSQETARNFHHRFLEQTTWNVRLGFLPLRTLRCSTNSSFPPSGWALVLPPPFAATNN